MSCGIANAIAFSPTMAYCWVCSKIRQKRGEKCDIDGFTPFSTWDTSSDEGIPMHTWERIGLIITVALNILGPIALVIWYLNANNISLVREDINEPAVMQQVIIVTSICGALLLGFILLAIFVSYDKNNPKCCRFGHLHRSDEIIRPGMAQRIYCPRCGKDFGEYRILSTMDRETCEVTDYDKDGNRL